MAVALPSTLASLLQHPQFGLRLLTPESRIDRPISWVSSSDLVDPTPFLQDGQMLLTTGRQFTPGSDGDTSVSDYVARLHHHGVEAVGFGTEVVRAGTPLELVEACRLVGIPLVEVPYRTPFIAIIRWVADAIAAEDRAREKWTIEAQRAINTAALTAGGADAALRALARHTGRSALRFDAEARVTSTAGTAADTNLTAEATREVARLLQHGGRAASSLVVDGRTVEVQTLGRDGQGRGALALIASEGDPGDRAMRTVIGGAVALIEMSMRDQAAATSAASALGKAFVSLALDGEVGVARRMARAGRLDLPEDPVRAVVVTASGAELQRIHSVLRDRLRRVILAPAKNELTVVCPANDVETVATALGASTALDGSAAPRSQAGVSAARPLDEVREAILEARAALDNGRRGGQSFAYFERTAETSLARLVDGDRAAQVAGERLATLESLPEARVWLQHNGQFDPAARELGIHRHSLKAKIAKLAGQTGLDLDAFAGRAELWILLDSLPRAGAAVPR